MSAYRLNNERNIQAVDVRVTDTSFSFRLLKGVNPSILAIVLPNKSIRIVCKINRHQHCFGTFSEVSKTSSENPELSRKGRAAQSNSVYVNVLKMSIVHADSVSKSLRQKFFFSRERPLLARRKILYFAILDTNRGSAHQSQTKTIFSTFLLG